MDRPNITECLDYAWRAAVECYEAEREGDDTDALLSAIAAMDTVIKRKLEFQGLALQHHQATAAQKELKAQIVRTVKDELGAQVAHAITTLDVSKLVNPGPPVEAAPAPVKASDVRISTPSAAEKVAPALEALMRLVLMRPGWDVELSLIITDLLNNLRQVGLIPSSWPARVEGNRVFVRFIDGSVFDRSLESTPL